MSLLPCFPRFSSLWMLTTFGSAHKSEKQKTTREGLLIRSMPLSKHLFNMGQGLGVVRGLVHELLAIIVGEVITALSSLFVGDA